MRAWRAIAHIISRTRSSEHYELLNQNGNGSAHERNGFHDLESHPKSRRRRGVLLRLRACLGWLTFRKLLLLLLGVLCLLAFAILLSGVPPSYNEYYKLQRNLPQHNLSLPFPEGFNGRYIRFANQVTGHGVNNVLQEVMLLSHLAYSSRRAYVFEDYIWSHTPLPYTIYDFALRPARIPLNAFITGPSAGGALPVSSTAPRAVSLDWWNIVCPPSRTVQIDVKEVMDNSIRYDEGLVIMNTWVEKLKNMEERCVEIGKKQPAIFDPFLFGSRRVLSLWPTLSVSPIMTHYSWSPLVLVTVARNLDSFTSSQDVLSHAPIPGLVACHLRRGDYIRHCPRLATWGATYMGFNQFDELPDKFEPPPFNSWDGRNEYFTTHCWPSVEQIVEKLHAARADHKPKGNLNKVFILTNGWPSFVNQLRKQLEADGWELVRSSWDLELDNEGKYVSMAVDMALAQRAEVFVGNGFSSLTSNAVTLRMAQGQDVATNRFWKRNVTHST